MISKLQQYLPLAVLKLDDKMNYYRQCVVATVLTACGIETIHDLNGWKATPGCNSTYRLRY